MLVHPWDAARSDDEWRDFLTGRDFGQLIASGTARTVPVVVPTHFLYDAAADTVLLHLARPNPVWAAIDENPVVLLTVIGDYTFIPGGWNAEGGNPPVPTSYYATVQLQCHATVVDDDEGKRAILTEQLGHFEPGVGYELAGDAAYSRLLPGIRGLRLQVTSVTSKFKYGGNKSAEKRAEIAGHLAARDAGMDAAARTQLLRRS